MSKKATNQMSFFDLGIQDKGGIKSSAFLREMKAVIPFDAMEAMLREKGIIKSPSPKGGRPAIPVRILLGALFLQNWYGLSDPMTEEMIHDRISFRKFLDIKEDDNIPDETTICKFRNTLIEESLLESLFALVKARMQQEGLILKEGTLVDATLIHAPEPKFTNEKDEEGKTRKKASHPQASYVSKRGRKHHGYKMHTATDRRGIITGVKGTTASVHDSQVFDELSEEEEKAVFGDSAHMSQERKRKLRAKGIFCGIIERRVRGQSRLRAKQQRNNKRFAPIRALVEFGYAYIKRKMNFREARYEGIHKNHQHFHLLAACFNLAQIPWLRVKCAKA